MLYSKFEQVKIVIQKDTDNSLDGASKQPGNLKENVKRKTLLLRIRNRHW